MIWVHLIQDYTPTTDAKEAEVDQFCEDLQDLLAAAAAAAKLLQSCPTLWDTIDGSS